MENIEFRSKPADKLSGKISGVKFLTIMLAMVLVLVVAKQEIEVLFLKKQYHKLEQAVTLENNTANKSLDHINFTIKELHSKQEDALQKYEKLRADLQELVNGLQTPDNIWVLSEALFLVHVAEERMVLNKDLRTAQIILTTVDNDLQRLQQAELADVRKLLGAAITTIQASKSPDIDVIWYKLGTLINKLDEILANATEVSDVKSTNPEVKAEKIVSGGFRETWQRIWQELKGLVVIRDKQSSENNLYYEKHYALTILRLQLEVARFAAVERHSGSYKQALAVANNWLQRLNKAEPGKLTGFDGVLAELQAADLDPQIPELTPVLDAIKLHINSYRSKIMFSKAKTAALSSAPLAPEVTATQPISTIEAPDTKSAPSVQSENQERALDSTTTKAVPVRE